MKYQTTEEAYAAGIEAGRKIERSECWDEINRHIKRGKLDGNGCDATAQNNGMVLAANLLMERIQVKTPNDLKLSDGRGWRGPCMAGGEGDGQEAGAVTHGAVRCSAWLGHYG